MTYRINDNGIDRDMTEEETAAHEVILADFKQKEKEAKARTKAKQAVIEKLGLTQEELDALLS